MHWTHFLVLIKSPKSTETNKHEFDRFDPELKLGFIGFLIWGKSESLVKNKSKPDQLRMSGWPSGLGAGPTQHAPGFEPAL